MLINHTFYFKTKCVTTAVRYILLLLFVEPVFSPLKKMYLYLYTYIFMYRQLNYTIKFSPSQNDLLLLQINGVISKRKIYQ